MWGEVLSGDLITNMMAMVRSLMMMTVMLVTHGGGHWRHIEDGNCDDDANDYDDDAAAAADDDADDEDEDDGDAGDSWRCGLPAGSAALFILCSHSHPQHLWDTLNHTVPAITTQNTS